MSDLTWTTDKARLDSLSLWEHNPKWMPKKRAERLLKSWRDLGQYQTLAVGPSGEVYDGHQRIKTLNAAGYPGEYVVEVRRASRPLTDDERKRVILESSVGTVGAIDWDNIAAWDNDLLDSAGFDAETLALWNDDAANLATMLEVEVVENCTEEKGAQPNPRKLPIDIIFTTRPTHPSAFVAVDAGWKIGINSSDNRLYHTERYEWAFKIEFIDNLYDKYDHAIHKSAVKALRPKYATVRDIMTEEQCAEAGIKFFELDMILDWAEELREYAENIIVIPKYDCLDKIPNYFMLGYSIPTSHGGTPLPFEIFKGWRVHLLGGSWGEQLRYMSQLGDDVVSLDNNYIEKQSQFGGYVLQDGGTGQLKETLGLGGLVNGRLTALSISLGAIAAKINELYSPVATNPA